MAHKIGVYGSNITESEHAVALAHRLGRELARRECIVITGACSGMPYIVAHEAHQHGAQIWGYTPELDASAHRRAYPQDDITIYNRLMYMPANYGELFGIQPTAGEHDFGARLKYRNAISTINSDAGIIVSGGWGTLNEFTNLIYEGKPIGVLTSSGGLADQLPGWYAMLPKKSSSIVVFSDDPDQLLDRLLALL